MEKHRTEFDKKIMEVISMKKSHQSQEAELKYEIDRLKGQLQKSKDDFAKAQEKNKRVSLISLRGTSYSLIHISLAFNNGKDNKSLMMCMW